jgi:hypothetical protein
MSLGTVDSVARHKFAMLEKHCEDLDQDYDAINRNRLNACRHGRHRREGPPNALFGYPGDIASYRLIGTVG